MIDWIGTVEKLPIEQADKNVENRELVAALSVEQGHLDFSDRPKEKAIRDIFDAFLTDLAEFEHHICSGLVRSHQVAPYLQYWAKQMTGKGQMKREEVWEQLECFIEVYDYKAVKKLFWRIGYPFAGFKPDLKTDLCEWLLARCTVCRYAKQRGA